MFDDMHDAIFDAFATQAIYTPEGGEPVIVDIIPEFDLTKWGDAVSVNSQSAIVGVRVSQVPERPHRGDSITSGEMIMYVDDVLVSDGYIHRCLVAVQ